MTYSYKWPARFRDGFHMSTIAVSQELTPIHNDGNAVRPQVD